jgi:Fur family iron response transcriptional regulator
MSYGTMSNRVMSGLQGKKFESVYTELEGCDASQTCVLCPKTCVSRDVGVKLRKVGLRCTRQRLELGRLLFAKESRHFTADILHEETKNGRVPISLATVYNTLQLFMKAGLVRRLATVGTKTWFDTN